MPYTVIHTFPGATEAQYRATINRIHPADGSIPPGQLVHTAGASDEGWTVVAIFDSKQTYEQFRDTVLMPTLAAGIEGAFTAPPIERGFETSVLQQRPKVPAQAVQPAIG